MKLNQYIDHTLLKPTATILEIQKLCQEAKNHQFYAICVNSIYVSVAKEALKNSDVRIAAVVGFPLGANSTEAKIAEARNCVENGADEIDMVINIGMLKSGELAFVQKEISEIKKVIGNAVLKVIIETCFLSENEKRSACEAALKGNADFVKTSTGFGTGGATLEDVQLMKEVVGDQMKIKASGGIKDRDTAEKYLALGVERIGTSAGIKIIN